MAASKSDMKIVWALDAFDETPEMLAFAREALLRWSSRTRVSAIPVYVLSPRELNLAEEMVSPWIHEYKPAAEKALHRLIGDLSLGAGLEVAAPQVLLENVASTRQAVQALSDFAVRSEADLILASSHGRRGLARLIMGSFAETLVLRSRVPVMVTGRDAARDLPPFDHILVPTDFDKGFRAGFRYVVNVARELGARITIFHSVPRPIEPILQSGVYLLGGGWVPVQSYFSTEIERIKRRADSWARWAKKQGVETDRIIDEAGSNISEDVLRLAQSRKIGVIAMEAHSGPISAALIGSITREVARHAPCPVWIFRRDMNVLAQFRCGRDGKNLFRRAA